MVIFLSILKIIGIVLLVLGLVIAAILFIPFSYEFDGDIDKGCYSFRLHWLFRFIRFRFRFQEKAEAILTILFFRVDFTDPVKKEKRRKRKEKRTARKRRKRRKKKEKQRKSYERERARKEKDIDLDTDSSAVSVQTAAEKAEPADIPDEEKERNSAETNAVHAAAAVEKSAEAAGIPVPEGIKNAVHILKLLYEGNVFCAFFPKLQIFLLRIRPRKLKGEIKYGFPDPATTGQVLGAIAVIPFLYQTDMVIYPDFETDKTYVRGNVHMKGWIFGIHLLIFLIHILSNKNIRGFITAVRKK